MRKLKTFGIIAFLVVLLLSIVACSTGKQQAIPENDLTLLTPEVETKQQEKVEWNPGRLAAEQILEMQNLSEIKFDENGIFRKEYPVVIDGQDVKLSVALDRKIVELIIDELLVNNGLKDTPENRAKFEEKALEIHLGNQAIDAECDYMQTAPILPPTRGEIVNLIRSTQVAWETELATSNRADKEYEWACQQIIDLTEEYLETAKTAENYEKVYTEFEEKLETLVEELRPYFI